MYFFNLNFNLNLNGNLNFNPNLNFNLNGVGDFNLLLEVACGFVYGVDYEGVCMPC